jgi:hypothetical protein
MSRTYNTMYFDAMEEIESSGEDYNRGHAYKLLLDAGMPGEEATKYLDDLETRWDIMVESLAEQKREQE